LNQKSLAEMLSRTAGSSIRSAAARDAASLFALAQLCGSGDRARRGACGKMTSGIATGRRTTGSMGPTSNGDVYFGFIADLRVAIHPAAAG
jgi:hypothetical protein